MANYLRQGMPLNVGDYLTSSNGRYCLTLKENATLRIFWGSSPGMNGQQIWSSPVPGTPRGAFFARILANGSLAIVNGEPPDGDGTYIWQTGGWANQDYVLIMQDDANLCIYDGQDPTPRPPYAYWCAAGATPFVVDKGLSWFLPGFSPLPSQGRTMVMAANYPGAATNVSIQYKDTGDWRWRILWSPYGFRILDPATGLYLQSQGRFQLVTLGTVEDDRTWWNFGGPEYPDVPPYRRAVQSYGPRGQNLNVPGDYPSWVVGASVIVYDWIPQPPSNLVWTMDPDPVAAAVAAV